MVEDGKDEAATAVEYAIMVAAIAAVVVGTVLVVGLQVQGLFDCTEDSIRNEASRC